MVLTGADGTIRDVNPAALLLFGYADRSELVGYEATVLAGEETGGAALCLSDLLRQAAGGTVTGEARLTLRRKDGSLFRGDVQLGPVRQSENRITGMILTIRQSHVREGDTLGPVQDHDLLRQAHRLGKIGVWEFDVPTGRYRWSEGMYDLMERDPLLGPPSREELTLYYTREQSRIMDAVTTQTISCSMETSTETETTFPDGTTKYLHSCLYPVTGRDAR
jgi:PAS domain S-box-containing protein